ncbi:unnamed protein product [Allacma fusca]|uniref:Uncharacterized protein n=1 Tax=Allacma fusca TaxID=39272 RepID=A0A8J2KLT9_9HEXA|nr:unnamed protein product [Allacma fusca]
MKRTFNRDRHRWEDFIDASDKCSESDDDVGNEVVFFEPTQKTQFRIVVFALEISSEDFTCCSEMYIPSLVLWNFLVKCLWTQALGSVREHFGECRSRLQFHFMGQREASTVYTRSFSRSRILRTNSSDRDSELRTLHEDVTLKNTLIEHQLESLESADQVTAVISAEQNSCELPGFRHGDTIEGNLACSEPKEATVSTFIPAVTNQNLATLVLPPPTVNMNKNVEMLDRNVGRVRF